MTKLKNFHGLEGSFHAKVGYWKTVRREHTHKHVATFSRRVLYRFKMHTHPYAQRLMTELVTKDIDGLEALDTNDKLRTTFFEEAYKPATKTSNRDAEALGSKAVGIYAPARTNAKTPLAEEGLPVDELDFDYSEGAYAVYNWEVFYHVPFTLAVHLGKNGRYADAQRWFHYIFDPTDNSDPAQGPERFWKVKPFKIDEVEHIQETLFNLATGDDPTKQASTVRAISAWRNSPLRPHLVARTRPTAYMYATVMAYLDNLIAWGDSLFRQDTQESINEARQLYVLAANILGPRPQSIPKRGTTRKQTYASLRDKLDEFGNAAVKLEAELGFDLFPPPTEGGPKAEHAVIESIGKSLYFCIPRNQKLIGYWDTVADRLYKIRNSLNLQGVFRQLPLFAPPIDPAMLARAVNAGVDVGAIIDGTANEIAPVRFPVLLQRALEMCQEVKSLGGQILAAIEKKDNEALGVLRAKHEKNLLCVAKEVRLSQWKETIKNREGIEANIENAFQRYRYYERLLGRPDADIAKPAWTGFVAATPVDESTRTFGDEPVMPARDVDIDLAQNPTGGAPDRKLSSQEDKELERLGTSQAAIDVAGGLEGTASVLNLIPAFAFDGKFWGIGAGATFGGVNVARLLQAMASVSRSFAARYSYEANQAAKIGSYARREQDWAFQANAAAGELNQLYKQLRSAEIREHIAKTEHDNHLKQEAQSEEVHEFLTNEKSLRSGKDRKTTTEEFYLWMKGEAQALHAQTFQFAYELAKKAERALRWELAEPDTKPFIGSGYLTGREGLNAGEKLHLDLKRMEAAYAELNTRDHEITKHVSLREWFPRQLIQLRQTGTCDPINLEEALFDLDCPGHVFRRIKSVALSIPCVTGPYASVNCSLTLSANSVRVPGLTDPTPYAVAKSSIVTSSAQSDTGMFETKLRDDRHLPFEGAGAISTWNIALLGKPRSFDYDTIADVVLTIRYTARDGGDLQNATKHATDWMKSNAARVFSMRHDFSSEWARFRRMDTSGNQLAVLAFDLTEDHFPYRFKGVTDTAPPTGLGQAKRLHLFFVGNAGSKAELRRNNLTLEVINNPVSGVAFSSPFDHTGTFEIVLSQNELENLWVVVDWTVGA